MLTVKKAFSSDFGSFPSGTEFYLVRHDRDGDMDYLILEKERRYKFPASVPIEMISEPISNDILTWQLRCKIAADIAWYDPFPCIHLIVHFSIVCFLFLVACDISTPDRLRLFTRT
jgi:hypothetical protein